jgi:hypothetical protein
MNNDLVNGLFECSGGILVWFNVFKLIRDKKVMGLYLPVSIFFTSWGVWNIYYYPSLNQMYSFYGGVLLAAANIVWISLAYYYKSKK